MGKQINKKENKWYKIKNELMKIITKNIFLHKIKTLYIITVDEA